MTIKSPIKSATFDKDMYQEVLDRCALEFVKGAVRKMVDTGHPDVMRVWNEMVDEEMLSNLPVFSEVKISSIYVNKKV